MTSHGGAIINYNGTGYSSFITSTASTTPSASSASTISARQDRSDFIDTMSWQITVLGLLASISIVLNLSTCFVHLRFRGRRSNFSSVILAISTLDIVFTAGQLGLSIATLAEPTSLQGGFSEDNGICSSGSMACRLVVLFPLIFILLESSFLAVGAFNRWLAIAKPDVPRWVKGRTCLISIMAIFLFLTIAVGINVVRDDIILLKSPDSLTKTTPTPLQFSVPSQHTNDSASNTNANGDDQSSMSVIPLSDSSSNSENETSSNSTVKDFVEINNYMFGCSILPSNTAVAVVTGVVVFYATLLAISISFLVVTFFHIWSLLPLPSADSSRVLKKMVLRRKPEFVNSKFVDGYKIMWATLLLWIVCSGCALSVDFAPLSTSSSRICLARRFITTSLLFLATLFKCFLYTGFSFTFRRAIFETFVAPCCTRFYRTQNYVVARSSPFDRHMRIAVVGREHEANGLRVTPRQQAGGDKFSPVFSSGIPTVMVPSANGDYAISADRASLFAASTRPSFSHSINNNHSASSDPSACFDVSDYPDLAVENGQPENKNRLAYLSPVNGNGANGLGFTSLANLTMNKSPRSSGGVRRIPVVIDDFSGGPEAASRQMNGARRSGRWSNRSTDSRYSNNSTHQRDDVSSSDVLVSATSLASPQPTSMSIAGEDENKL